MWQIRENPLMIAKCQRPSWITVGSNPSGKVIKLPPISSVPEEKTFLYTINYINIAAPLSLESNNWPLDKNSIIAVLKFTHLIHKANNHLLRTPSSSFRIQDNSWKHGKNCKCCPLPLLIEESLWMLGS